MAASNRHHRKLLEDSTNATATSTTAYQICVIQCHPQSNPTGVCSPDCPVICRSFCGPAESSPPPSSSPSPAISPYTLPTPRDHHHSLLSLPLKISLVFLFAAFVYTVYKFYTVWYRSRPHRSPRPSHFPENQNQQTHDQIDGIDHPIWYIRTTGLQQSVINAITVVNFGKSDGVVEGTCCSVCLSEFEEEDTLRLLPNCKHAFHISCIDTWLRSHTNCPLCRAGIADNSVDTPSPEENSDNLGFTGETLLGISTMRDDDRGEASGSSGLRIGETDEEHLNTTSPKRQGL